MNWRTIAYILENTVFLLIGLQAEWLFDDVGASELSPARITLVCGATLLGVIVLRLAWVFVARYLLVRPGPDPSTGRPPPWQYTFILGWAGMRGVVTLAAAYVIPKDFAEREILLLIAFTVVAGTLFLQGLTLPWLARAARGAGTGPARRRVGSGDPAPAGVEGRAEAARRARVRGPARHRRADQAADRPAQLRGLGAAGHDGRPGDAERAVRPAAAGDDRRRALPGAGDPSLRDGAVRGGRRGAGDAGRRGVDARGRDRGARGDRPRTPLAALDGEVCEDLEKLPRRRRAPGARSARRACVEGTRWVALRRCLECGNVACCDSSPRQHATRHFRDSQHPVMQSAEPEEDWRWCYVHHLTG